MNPGSCCALDDPTAVTASRAAASGASIFLVNEVDIVFPRVTFLSG
jgi:microcystin degradation protein MlrC